MLRKNLYLFLLFNFVIFCDLKKTLAYSYNELSDEIIKSNNFNEKFLKNGIEFLQNLQFSNNSISNETINGFNDQLCFKQLSQIFNGIKKKEIWALEVIDSWGKISSGILWLNLISMGNFDECLNVTKTFENDTDIIKGQYCLADVPINTNLFASNSLLKKPNEKPRMMNISEKGKIILTFGICIPRTCNGTMLQKAIENYLQMNFNSSIISEGKCVNNDPIVFKEIDWAAIIIFSIMGIILVLSSIYDYIMTKRSREKNQVLVSFSILTNGKKLFSMKKRNSPDVINCLDGIRCLSIVWVVYGHTAILMGMIASVNLKYTILEWTTTAYSMLVQSATVSVDSFLLLSGLLIAWVVLKELDRSKGKLNILIMYLHRYLRLTPLIAFTILFTVSVFRYTGSGPLWNTILNTTVIEYCENNWWHTLLYIQNYASVNQMCLGHTWYLAVDTQLYVLSPLILIPLWKWGMKFGWILFLLMAGSIAFVFITFMNKSFTLLMKDGLLNADRQSAIYYPTHARVTPWLVGVLLGYILHINKGKRIRLPKYLIASAWLISLGTIFAIIFGPYYRTQVGQIATTLEGAFYESFSRVTWAVALAWIIFACTNGYGGFINEFLSLPFWQPFSRLTYSIYITHMVVELVMGASTKVGTYFSDVTMVSRFYSEFGITLVVSTITVLAFESPIVGLEKLLFKRNNHDTQHILSNGSRTLQISQEQLVNNSSSNSSSQSNLNNGRYQHILNV